MLPTPPPPPFLALRPQRYHVYGLQTPRPSSEKEGTPPHPSCLPEERFAAERCCIGSHLGVRMCREGLKVFWIMTVTTTASAILGQRKKKSMVFLPSFILDSPLNFWPNPLRLWQFFFRPVLIGFIHAMQVCQEEGAASELGCRAGGGEDIAEGWKRMIEGEKEKENK